MKRGPKNSSNFALLRNAWHTFWQKEALDALAEFLHPVDFVLLHPPRPVGPLRLRLEGRNLLVHAVIERHVGDEVADDGKCLDRLNGDDFAGLKRVHPRHAHQLRMAVDLRRATAALARFAVPAAGEIRRLFGLDLVHDIEHHHAFLNLHRVIHELATVGVAAEYFHLHLICHAYASSTRDFNSAGISGRGCCDTVIVLCSLRISRLTCESFGS